MLTNISVIIDGEVLGIYVSKEYLVISKERMRRYKNNKKG